MIQEQESEVAAAQATKAAKSESNNVKGDTRIKNMTNSKKRSKMKLKPAANTLDRWFKPALDTVKDKEASEKPQKLVAATSSKDINKLVVEKKSKTSYPSRIQRHILITDKCRVCENVKTEKAARCELRCVTCSMTVHKNCYSMDVIMCQEDWNCRRCQFIYDATAWEDISGLIGVATPEGIVFPTCRPLDDKHKLHELHTDCDFAAVFLFLQRFRQLGLKLSSVVTTLESLANALSEPKENELCADLHSRLLTNVNIGISKKYPWYVHLLRFLREAKYLPAIAESSTGSNETEKCKELYFDLPLAKRVAILKFLCEAQFDRNGALIEQIGDEDAESMRNEPIGVDAAGRAYFVLEDAATVPSAAVWVCRCTGGTDWETVCNDLDSVKLLVRQLSLSIESADLQLWQALSRGVLKKLIRQQERRNRNERRKLEVAVSGVMTSSADCEGIGRRSLRNRPQVNYAIIDTEEDIVADSDNSDDETDVFEGLSDDDANSEIDEAQHSTCNSEVQAKKQKAKHTCARRSKRIRC